MSKKKPIPNVSKLDMHGIYYNLIVSGISSMPAFLIFEDQPFDEMRFCMPNGNDVLYFNNSDDIFDRIVNEIKEPNIDNDEAPDFMIHSLENEEVSYLYTFAVLLADALNIPCPQVEFRDNMNEYGKSIGDINLVTLNSAVIQNDLALALRFMAHEFRHLWQYKYHPEYNDMYVSGAESVGRYLNSLPENDAEAFSLKLMMEVFEVDELEDNEGYAGGDKEVKEKVISLRDKIQIDEECVWRLRALLGIEY